MTCLQLGQHCVFCRVDGGHLEVDAHGQSLRTLMCCQGAYPSMIIQVCCSTSSRWSASHLWGICHQGIHAASCRYRLRAADLEDLPHAAVQNPINANFTSMHLFRRPDVVRAAIKRWGGVAGMWKQVGAAGTRWTAVRRCACWLSPMSSRAPQECLDPSCAPALYDGLCVATPATLSARRNRFWNRHGCACRCASTGTRVSTPRHARCWLGRMPTRAPAHGSQQLLSASGPRLKEGDLQQTK